MRHEVIGIIAFYKWLDAGKPEGRDMEFWIAAEQEYGSRTRPHKFHYFYVNGG